MLEDLKEEAKKFIATADSPTLGRAITKLLDEDIPLYSEEKVMKALFSLDEEKFDTVARILAVHNAVFFGPRLEDPFELADLMPRLMLVKTKRESASVYKYSTEIYEFDHSVKKYIKVKEYPGVGNIKPIPSTGVLIGEERFAAGPVGTKVFELIDFKKRKEIVSMPEHYESVLFLPDKTLFFGIKRGTQEMRRNDKTLLKISPDGKVSKVNTQIPIDRVFLLGRDKILVTEPESKILTGEKSIELFSLDLEPLGKRKFPTILCQLSPTDFATKDPGGDYKSSLWRFDGKDFFVFQKLTQVEFCLSRDVLMTCRWLKSESGSYVYPDCYIWKRGPKGEYEQVMKSEVSRGKVLGNSLIQTSDPGKVILQKLGLFGFKPFRELPHSPYGDETIEIYTLPSTRKSRKGLVGRLEKLMDISSDTVDIVVGFL